MKITKRQLRRVIKEALGKSNGARETLRQARQYRTKGEWRLRVSGAGETYLKPGWRTGMEVEAYLGDYDEAKTFDNELSAIVDRDRIAADPANATAGRLEVEGAPHKG